MSEENAVPVDEKQDDTSDQDFDSGFGGAVEAPSATPPTETQDEANDTPPVQDPPPSDEPPPTDGESPAPEYVQMTRAEVDELMAKAAKIDDLQNKVDTSFGRFGQKLKDLTDKLQASAPAGAKIDITDEDVAELSAEFPEMGGLVKKTLEKVAGKLVGTGTAPAAPAFDPSVLTQVRGDAVSQAKAEIAAETLDATHEGWQAIVGLPDANGNKPDTPFRKWLATQPEAYQTKVNSTSSPFVIGKAIDAFQEHEKKAKAQADSRKARMSAGVNPRGAGSAPAPASTEDDEFNAGFRS